MALLASNFGQISYQSANFQSLSQEGHSPDRSAPGQNIRCLKGQKFFSTEKYSYSRLLFQFNNKLFPTALNFYKKFEQRCFVALRVRKSCNWNLLRPKSCKSFPLVENRTVLTPKTVLRKTLRSSGGELWFFVSQDFNFAGTLFQSVVVDIILNNTLMITYT